MARTRYGWAGLVLLAGAIGIAGTVAGAAEGKTAQGRPYASGGIGVDERDEMHRRRADFALRVVTAAKGSGAYLSGAEVKITDQTGKRILELMLDGPWLLADLTPGSYKVEVVYGGRTERKSATIRPGERRELMFYFEERE